MSNVQKNNLELYHRHEETLQDINEVIIEVEYFFKSADFHEDCYLVVISV